MSEWKPGDVAMVRGNHETTGVRAIWQGAQWATENRLYLSPWQVAARPLVVIDPEDAEQVNRLRLAVGNLGSFTSSDVIVRETQEALREFANPSPRIEEPTGLGAVVEDADGSEWHRTSTGRWIAEDGLCARGGGWVHVDAVRILSEGVPS